MSFESKRKEHPEVSGLVYSICRSVEGWTESPCADLEACLEIVINNRDYAFRFCALILRKSKPSASGDRQILPRQTMSMRLANSTY